MRTSDIVRNTMNSIPDESGGVVGLIALEATGRHAIGLAEKCEGLFRGYVTENSEFAVNIHAGEEWKAGNSEFANTTPASSFC